LHSDLKFIIGAVAGIALGAASVHAFYAQAKPRPPGSGSC
jgi:hypothetical protein